MNEDPKNIPTSIPPNRRAAIRRLGVIALVLFPIWWVVFALLVKNWGLNIGGPSHEWIRHLGTGAFIFIVAVVVVFLASLLPTVQRLFSQKNVRRMLIGLAWTATIIGLIYSEENWRGRHAWKKYKSEMEARGEQLELSAFVPKPVPPEENFAATPFVQSMFKRDTNGSFLGVSWNDTYSAAGFNVKGKNRRQFMDLVRWGAVFEAIRAGRPAEEISAEKQKGDSGKFDLASRVSAAPAVLNGLKTNEAVFAELRSASQRPRSLYPVTYDLENPWGILLPHLASIKATCLRLQLKVSAELALGENEKAFEDVKLMFYMTDSMKEEPFLVSYLVQMACFEITMQPIWEGLAEHCWTETQLQELQTRLQQYDFISAMKHPFDGERAAGILTAELLYRKKYKLSDLLGSLDNFHERSFGDELANFCGRMAPHGWYHFEQLNYSRLFQMQREGTVDATKKTIAPARVQSNSKELEREIGGGRWGREIAGVLHHQVIAAMMLPAMGGIPLKTAMAQASADEAVLACALERYRMAQGAFPEKLDALAPKFIEKLPHDVIGGEPLKYSRTNDGRFILYSIGWNEKDDHGLIASKNTNLPDRFLREEIKEEGDWVWSFPAQQ